MKVALVYDRVNKWGGAERVLLALHKIWPDAPLFTAVYDAKRAPWAKVFKVKPSFLQYLPFAKSYHELYPWLTPLAFETFSFDAYDLVVSVTSAEAKGIITKPHTLHICYCLTPTRYLWSAFELYQQVPGFGLFNGVASKLFIGIAPTLRRWDKIGSRKPDYYIAISRHIAERVKTYYQQDVVKVIYPPVEMTLFKVHRTQHTLGYPSKDYFLVVSRLVPYKRIDIIVQAFNELGWPLIIIGDGSDYGRLKTNAFTNTQFIRSHLTDMELLDYYERCRAVVIAADEDFGLTAVEAQRMGKPVIAYRQSGIAEIVKDKKTGLFFDTQSADALVSALLEFKKRRFDERVCQKRAEAFSQQRFTEEIRETVETLYQSYGKFNILSK